MVLATFIAAAFVMDPNDFIGMAKSAIASVFSVSNILFFTEAGYWDSQSELKPLLHTWSLGVEEQFYLLWPVLVLSFCKFARSIPIVWCFTIATIIGFFVSVWVLEVNRSAAFYLLPARFFEFSIGATFAFIGQSKLWLSISPRLRLTVWFVSLAVLLTTIVLYDGSTAFPGVNAILPCLATSCLLLCGTGVSQINIINAILGNSIMSWLGRISYSLYLVHWPVVSLMRYNYGIHLDLRLQLIAAAIIAGFTIILYYGVEARYSFRAGQNRSKKSRVTNGRFATYLGVLTFFFSSVFAHAIFNSGWGWRYADMSIVSGKFVINSKAILVTPEQVSDLNVARIKAVLSICKLYDYPAGKNCDENRKINVLVIGDSHETDGLNFLTAGYGANPDIQFIRFGQLNKCNMKARNGIVVLGNQECIDRVNYLTTPDFAKTIDVIVFSANKPFKPNERPTLEALRTLKEVNPVIKIVTIGPYIVTSKDCATLANKHRTFEACIWLENIEVLPNDQTNDKYYEDFIELSDVYIDKVALLCNKNIPKSCAFKTPLNEPMMLDTNHLTLPFTQFAGEKFAAQNPNFFIDFKIESQPD